MLQDWCHAAGGSKEVTLKSVSFYHMPTPASPSHIVAKHTHITWSIRQEWKASALWADHVRAEGQRKLSGSTLPANRTLHIHVCTQTDMHTHLVACCLRIRLAACHYRAPCVASVVV